MVRFVKALVFLMFAGSAVAGYMNDGAVFVVWFISGMMLSMMLVITR